jgi:putative PIN family toxin of toxin-antitoxin system
MLVVLDTNILFSALIAKSGTPGLIYRAWEEGAFRVATCNDQLEEIRRASRYSKFQATFKRADVGRLVNRLRQSRLIHPLVKVHAALDPDDSYLLDLADTSGSDFLITGDHRAGLLKRKRIGRAAIVTARAFVKIIGE